MSLRSIILILCFLCGFYLNITAQFRFERIGNQQGLSQSTVLKIFQDKKGFIWFVTRDGLNKYDGYSFTVYRHIFEDPNSTSTTNGFCEDSTSTTGRSCTGGILTTINNNYYSDVTATTGSTCDADQFNELLNL